LLNKVEKEYKTYGFSFLAGVMTHAKNLQNSLLNFKKVKPVIIAVLHGGVAVRREHVKERITGQSGQHPKK
jgi:hypothetical protein